MTSIKQQQQGLVCYEEEEEEEERQKSQNGWMVIKSTSKCSFSQHITQHTAHRAKGKKNFLNRFGQ